MTRTSLLGHVPVLAGFLPLVLLLLVGCGKSAARGEVKKLDMYAIQLETPAGWTGGGAGGTYEFRSPDGTGRVRVAALEGASSASELKDAQLMAGTGAVATSRVLPASPTRVGPLHGERARFMGSDGRLYDIVALTVPVNGKKMVVLVQTSTSAEHASSESSAVESMFSRLRQSIQYIGPADAATSGG
jgi:hypothetical protein